jgi:nucleoid DNA-binding protein
MPRKNTGMPVEAHPSPKVAENGERLLYVKPQSGLTKSLDDFETWFGDKYSLRKGEITRAFEAFLDAAPEWLAKGYRIETPFGSFAPKVRLKRQVTDPDDIYHDDIELEGDEE